MLHQYISDYTAGYCLKKDKEGCLHCRFYFSTDLLGFVPKYEDDMDGRGPYLVRPNRLIASAIEGTEYTDDDKITFLRNHPTLVDHNPELLTIWGANIEGRPVESYQQVVRYLLKYMLKNKPNSQLFESIGKAVVENAAEDGTVRKTFQQILMKTVGQHDFSKQECFHVLNGFEFVEMSKTIVKVNVMGTWRLRAPAATDTDATDLTEKNKASYYWNRENSE
jgi:hypothetical protein